jgi:short-subunit dehydrogenase involved in D-alanine esterification of teichoic acids
MHPSNHTVLITGGATGIGLALAGRFHAQGNRVILVGRSPSALADAAKALPGVQTHAADITLAADRERLFNRCADVSVLINNAGIRIDKNFDQVTEAELRAELDVNFLAPILLTQTFLPALKQRPEAAVINVSSGVALWPRQAAAMYNASKAAMHSFTKSLRWQLDGSSVRVFEVLPPLVESAMTAGRGRGKISPAQLADEFWAGYQADRYEMLIGKVKLLAWMRRMSPAFTDRTMRPPG